MCLTCARGHAAVQVAVHRGEALQFSHTSGGGRVAAGARVAPRGACGSSVVAFQPDGLGRCTHGCGPSLPQQREWWGHAGRMGPGRIDGGLLGGRGPAGRGATTRATGASRTLSGWQLKKRGRGAWRLVHKIKTNTPNLVLSEAGRQGPFMSSRTPKGSVSLSPNALLIQVQASIFLGGGVREAGKGIRTQGRRRPAGAGRERAHPGRALAGGWQRRSSRCARHVCTLPATGFDAKGRALYNADAARDAILIKPAGTSAAFGRPSGRARAAQAGQGLSAASTAEAGRGQGCGGRSKWAWVSSA
jgi:hypothetical protein